jgi:superfamily II DNA/RNA helicase
LAATEGGIESILSSSPASPSPEVRFEDLGLGPQLLRAVADSGYLTPTPIQARGIPKVLAGKDLIGIAQTGTGKTASFTLPMIEILARGRAKARMPRSLILEPTRELAAQVAESFERYGKHHKLNMALLIGGVSYEDQDRKLDRGVDVLIATPGRLLDHFERGKLMLTGVQILVIDEADRMLDMGFIPDVERIAKLIPFTRQTLFYSATMPPEIQRLTDQFLQAPVRIEVSRPATAATTIVQVAMTVPGGDWSKRESLRRLIRENEVKNAIVFCNRKKDVDILAKSLAKHGFSTAPLHGDLDQSVRTKTLDAFRAGEIAILVASDVAARGLDIPSVSHIFNFDVPIHADDYVHRIGRTGRAGRTGHAFMLVGHRDEKYVDAIEKLTGQKIERRVMEGLPEEVERAPRAGGSEPRGRDRGRPRRREEHAPRPVEAAKPVPEAAERPAPRKEEARPAREIRPVAAKAPAPAPAKAPDLSEFPAFLLRPVRFPAKQAKS